MTELPGILPEPAGPVQITVCPDGPLLVRGPVQIIDAAGEVLPRTRQTLALCRCGKSRLAPLCDGTHKLGAARARIDTAADDDMPKADRT